MKKLGIFLFLIGGIGGSVFAQLPNTDTLPDVQDSHPARSLLINHQNIFAGNLPGVSVGETGVVIIDDDELGISVSPNPANTHVTFTTSQDLTGSTLNIIDSFSKLVLQQSLSSTTITVKDFSNGIYYFFFIDNKNQLIGEGSFAVQH